MQAEEDPFAALDCRLLYPGFAPPCFLQTRLETRARISSPADRQLMLRPAIRKLQCCLPVASCTAGVEAEGVFNSPTLGCRLMNPPCPALLLQSHGDTGAHQQPWTG